MTIPYTTNIPFANNDPSVDQPNMKINTNSIDQILNVDHVSFNTAGGGRHEQVTFDSNNVPAIPTSPPVLFTNTVAGLPQLFFYSGPDAAHTSAQYVAALNGSTFLLGGIIMKWGKVIGAANNTAVVFVSAFPNACFSVQVTGGAPAGTQPTVNVNTGSVSVGGFVIKMQDPPSDVFYIAIGN